MRKVIDFATTKELVNQNNESSNNLIAVTPSGLESV